MNRKDLEIAVAEIQEVLNTAITKAEYKGKKYSDGLVAKNSLIRSSTLIQRIHDLTKKCLINELNKRKLLYQVHPPFGCSQPELSVWGLLKKKKQDVVVLIGDSKPAREKILEGPLMNGYDELGLAATKSSIVIGVRSQLSSVNKNFDTLMERAFAETMNLRMRHPYLVMGEVYLLAVKDYDEQKMKKNVVGWKPGFTKVERFISIFNAISHRNNHDNIRDSFKYERSVLLLVDFSKNPAKIYFTIDELKTDGVVSQDFSGVYEGLSPQNFARDILDSYFKRHDS
jgi:hypothetical protein